MKNENCLEGMRCPKCGQDESFNFRVTASADVTDDGTDTITDVGWDDGAIAVCNEATCQWHGHVKDLRVTP